MAKEMFISARGILTTFRRICIYMSFVFILILMLVHNYQIATSHWKTWFPREKDRNCLKEFANAITKNLMLHLSYTFLSMTSFSFYHASKIKMITKDYVP